MATLSWENAKVASKTSCRSPALINTARHQGHVPCPLKSAPRPHVGRFAIPGPRDNPDLFKAAWEAIMIWAASLKVPWIKTGAALNHICGYDMGNHTQPECP